MSTIYCNACNVENHSHSIKCEQCKTPLSQENISPMQMHDEWENDFLYIENAEIKGEIFKIENLGDDDKICLGFKQITNEEIVQAVKEEPEFHIETEFTDHEEQSHDSSKKSPYECKTCHKCFKRKAGLICHIRAAHSNTDSESEPSDKDTHEKTSIISRIPSNISKFSSKYQDENKSTQSIIIKCDYCNDSFANSNELNVHRKICATKEKFFCDVCDIYLSSRAGLIKHNKSRQHLTYLEKPSVKDEHKFVCIFCGERFPLQILLTNHKKVHNEESILLNESTRIQRIDGRLTYICTICDKSTTNKSGHTEHLRVHTKEKPAKCDLCGSAFTTRSSLARHMSLHSDERPYECNICGVNYRHKRNLRKHLFMHTGERPFKCKYCDKTFALRFTFNDHVRLLHTKETPYQCEKCMQSFKTSYLLNLHRRKEHNIDTNTKRKVEKLENNLKQ